MTHSIQLIPAIRLFLAATLLAASTAAWSGAETGLYLGVSVGSADQDYDTDDVDLDDDTTAGKVFVGYNFGWLPLIDLAVEGSYVDFGEVSNQISTGNASADATLGITGFSGFGVAGFKFTLFSLFAKVGLINWESDARIGTLNADDSGSDDAFGIGVKFQIASLALRVEYEQFDVENTELSLYSVGVAWTF